MDPDLIFIPFGLAQIRTWRETRTNKEAAYLLSLLPGPCLSFHSILKLCLLLSCSSSPLPFIFPFFLPSLSFLSSFSSFHREQTLMEHSVGYSHIKNLSCHEAKRLNWSPSLCPGGCRECCLRMGSDQRQTGPSRWRQTPQPQALVCWLWCHCEIKLPLKQRRRKADCVSDKR